MSQISVVIASLLKPVDDTRMFEKLGLSLAQTNKYEINIIGFSIKKNIFRTNVNSFPVFQFRRMGLARIIQPFKYLNLLVKVKPKIIIVNSADFLLVTLFYSFFTRSIFIYDIQENYYRNIRYNSGLFFPLNHILAFLIRCIEYVIHPFVHHYLVAENGYFMEMPYIRKKGVLIRNLYADIFSTPTQVIKTNSKFRILYSGTIAKAYGIFKIIQFIISFHNLYSEIEFTIIGHCAHRLTLEKLNAIITDKPYIKIVGGNELVPHEKIVEAIRDADFGILNYELNPAIINCFPTKIYEYMGNRLPFLIQKHAPWSDFCLQHEAAIAVDFETPDYKLLFQSMKNNKFYTTGIPNEIFWKKDEQKLLDLFDRINKT